MSSPAANDECEELKQLAALMLARLASAAAVYEASPQKGATHALVAVTDFAVDLATRQHGADVTLLTMPLMRLSEAMATIADGVADPLLHPLDNRRKGVKVSDAMARAEAAGVMNALMLTGLAERDAAKAVARCLNGSAIMLSTTGDAATAVVNWRKTINGLRERRHEIVDYEWSDWERHAARTYNWLSERARHQIAAGIAPENIRTRFLAGLRSSRGRRRKS